MRVRGVRDRATAVWNVGIYNLDELDDDSLEKEGFLELFLGWRESDEYQQYAIKNEVNQMDYECIGRQGS